MLSVVACSNQDEKKSSNSPATSKSVSSSMKKKDNKKNETIRGTTAGMKTAFTMSSYADYTKAVASVYTMYQEADIVFSREI
ncbi:hypothetical protein GCM10020331_002970 [Ectobacillus funiculus]